MRDKVYFSGLLYASLAGMIWGCVQVLYFNHIKHISPIEIVAHRAIWAFFILFIIILITKRIKKYYLIFQNKKDIIYLSTTAILVSSNWFFFILAVSLNRVQDSSMGYFISPILSVAFGFIFFKEKLSKLQIISITLIIISICNLIFNLGSVPWIALSLATTWSIYGLLRKKINVDSEIGLLFETSLLIPIFIIILFYGYYYQNNNFTMYEINDLIFLIGGGIVTVVPLFFFNLGLKMVPLGVAGLVFYLVPTLQFVTSILFLQEELNIIKLYSFLIIWIAIIIFIYESSKNNS